MSFMSKFTAYLFVSLSFFAFSNSVQAGAVFELSATTIDADGSFALDDVVTGSIELEETAAQAGGLFSAADLIGFSFAAGDVVLDFASSFVSNFQGQVSDDGSEFSFLSFDLESAPFVNGCGDSGCFASFEIDLVSQAVITNIDLLQNPDLTGFIVAEIDFERIVNVNEPANLAVLFAFGFLAVAAVRRRTERAGSRGIMEA